MARLEWEELCPNTYRMKVPGGWIIRYQTSMVGDDCTPQPVSITVAMCFVPCEPTANGSGV